MPTAGDLDVVAADSSTMASRCGLVVLDDEQLPHGRASTKPARSPNAALERLVADRLLGEARGAGAQRLAALVVVAEITCTGMWRVRGSCLSWSSTASRPCRAAAGRAMIGVRLELVGQRQAGVARAARRAP